MCRQPRALDHGFIVCTIAAIQHRYHICPLLRWRDRRYGEMHVLCSWPRRNGSEIASKVSLADFVGDPGGMGLSSEFAEHMDDGDGDVGSAETGDDDDYPDGAGEADMGQISLDTVFDPDAQMLRISVQNPLDVNAWVHASGYFFRSKAYLRLIFRGIQGFSQIHSSRPTATKSGRSRLRPFLRTPRPAKNSRGA